MTASSHKQIKKRYGCLSGMAKEYGLKLRWRFAREVKVTEVYVHPEWIQSTETEYQAWVLVTAREVPMTEADKRNALLDSVVGQLEKDERENPSIGELPDWVAEPFEYDGDRALTHAEQREQEARDMRGVGEKVTPFELPEFDDPHAIVAPLDVNYTKEERAI